MNIVIDLPTQILSLFENSRELFSCAVSTAANGPGEEKDSKKTPRGRHIIRAKIGKGMPINTVFKGRRPTGEIYHLKMKEAYPDRDWILTRILWLSGLEVGKNRLGNVDTMQRYIYIHGAPEDVEMGKTGSHGCIRIHNATLLDLFDRVSVGCSVEIKG